MAETEGGPREVARLDVEEEKGRGYESRTTWQKERATRHVIICIAYKNVPLVRNVELNFELIEKCSSILS